MSVWLVAIAACLMALASESQAQGTVIAATSFAGVTAVGHQSAPLDITITIATGEVAATPKVLTQGIANLDFTFVAGGSCASGISYSAGQQCTVSVLFTPKYPGRRSGAVVVESSGGAVLGVTFLTGTATGSLSVLIPGRIDTVAGDADWVYKAGDDGIAATQAPIFLPTGVVADAAGNIYISDSSNNRIRRVDATTGLISTMAGTGTPGYSGDGGLATEAMISNPAGIIIDGAGNLYFADSGNHAIRRIDAVSGWITTVAGVPTEQGYSGDGLAATSAKLTLPEGLAFDTAQNLYIADSGNNAIREVDATTGSISTFAGTGIAGFYGDGSAATAARLNSPRSVTVGGDGALYIADMGNNAVRKVGAGGVISTVAGNATLGFSGDGGAATEAQLYAPASVVFDPAGNMYIADSGNNRVRKVYASTQSILTIAGTDSEQFTGDAGPASLASLYGPYALFMEQTGNLYIVDMFHNRVRRISADAIALQFATMRVSKVSAIQTEGLENDGNANMTLAAPTLVNGALDPATTNCTTGAVVPSDTFCDLGVEFAPTVIGNPVTGAISVNTDAVNAPAIISLSGEVLSVEPTSVTLTSSTDPSLIGAAVTFTATVKSNSTTLTGTIIFFDGATQLCSVSLGANGAATCAISTLALGQHAITASYSGDTLDAASVSSPLNQVVKQSATLTLAASPNPDVVTGTVTLTATAMAPNGTPTGSVAFYDGATAFGSSSLNASGIATFATSALTAATHNLTAQYAGDATNEAALSNAVSEVVNLATTSTTLGTSNANANVGTAITFTATVASSNGPLPTGSVQFKDGTSTLGSGSLNGAGVATLALSTLTPGVHSIIATYDGDNDNATSASADLVETINQIATTTVVVSDANPASAGATIHLTATVAMASGATADGLITGSVTFSEGTITLGVVPVNASGQATLAVSTLAAGSHTISANFGGNTNYAASTSLNLSEQIQTTATTTNLSTTTPASVAGKPVIFTITVTSSTGIPTGTVAIHNGSALLGQVTLNAQGGATFTLSTLPLGTQMLTATYSGDANYVTSVSTVVQVVVSLATTALTLAGPATPIDAGAMLVVTATLTTNGIAPTGALTLRDSSASIATQTISATGSFAFSTASLAIGTHTLTAAYAGDSNNAAAVSATITVVVQQAQSVTTLSSSANPSVFGQSITLTAAITSDSPSISGSISFMDGATALGSVPVLNGAASLASSGLAFGAHRITAVYSGDTNHAASTSSVIVEQIVQSPSEALTSSLNPSVSGANVVFTATVTGVGAVIPTGNAVFKDDVTTLGSVALNASGVAIFATTALGVGSHTISVSYSGDTSYATATALLTQTVQNANTQIALSASANPATYGVPLTLTATISSDGSVATGTVSFSDGSNTIGSAPLNAIGVAALTLSTLAPGNNSIVASYVGDGKANASASVPYTLVVKQLTSVLLTTSANPTEAQSPIIFTATVTNSGVGAPSGTVTFCDGSTELGTATLDASGKAQLTVPTLTTGSHSIQVSYAGDISDFSSASSSLIEGVQLRPTTTTLSTTATDPANLQEVTLISVVRWTGTAAPTGTVSFSVGNTDLGSSAIDATGVATLSIVLQNSPESITASYSGDSSYAASASVATTVTAGVATQFTLSMDPASINMQSKQHEVVNLTIVSVQGFADTLQFGCLGLPYAATCTFNPAQATLTANGTASVQLTIDTANPLGAGSQARLRAAPVLFCLLPGALMAGLLFPRRRRNSWLTLLLLFCALAATLSVSGCSGLQMTGTPPGTYSFKVSASGQQTGITEAQVMTMTVTQ
jgi:sugar lactone lactonase YvrE